jgi:probable rRNA maturation factor
VKNSETFIVRIHKADIERLPESITEPIDRFADLIRDAVHATLEAEGKPPRCEISIIFVSNNKIRELNNKYREVDLPTDVMCFPYSTRAPFKCDMFISVEASYIQSKQFGHSHQKEIIFLVIHGILHLLGWPDNKDSLKKRMLERQVQIMKLIKDLPK